MTDRPDILCIGAVLWDVIGRNGRTMQHGADMPGRIRHIPGGVALNVAVALARWGMRPAVLSAVGRDAEGDALVAACDMLGVGTRFLARDTGLPTDCYMAIEDAHGLVAAIADANSLEQAGDAILTPLRDGRLASADAPWQGIAIIDGNLAPAQLGQIVAEPGLAGADLRVVSASTGKADRLVPLLDRVPGCIYVNRIEAELIARRPFATAAEAAAHLVHLGAARVLVTDGGDSAAEAAARAVLIEAIPPRVAIARVTGAGDCFLAAHIAAERAGASRREALEQAAAAAATHVSGKDMP